MSDLQKELEDSKTHLSNMAFGRCEACIGAALTAASKLEEENKKLREKVKSDNREIKRLRECLSSELSKRDEQALKKESKPEQEKCWFCDGIEPDTTINVACDVPNGKPTEPHDVRVHHGCYMDMDQ